MNNIENKIGQAVKKCGKLAKLREGIVSCDSFSEKDKYQLSKTAVLQKQKGKDFIILNITDIHFSDFDDRFFLAFHAMNTVKKLVEKVQPDLITVTGDMVCGASTVLSVERFRKFMDSFRVPWAPVFGNHDGEANCDKNYLADVLIGSPYCLMKKGDPEMGCGNYIVNILEEGVPVESLIMMDNGRSSITEKQKTWFRWASDGINALSPKNVKVTPFMHIPIAQYQYALDEYWNEETKRWKTGTKANGFCYESVCCHRLGDGKPYDDGFFYTVKECGHTAHILCGHEHMNDYSVLYDGIRLTYTLKVGFGSGFQPKFNGGTKITVGENGMKRLEHIAVYKGFLFKTLEDIDLTKDDGYERG